MTGPGARESEFICASCGFSAYVRPGAGWSNCPECGSDRVVAAAAEEEPAAAAEPPATDIHEREGD